MYGSDIAETFLRAQRADGRSPRTLRTYRNALLRLGRFLFARSATFIDATQEDLIAYRCSVQDDQLAERTQHLYAVIINVFYRWCHVEGHVKVNPAAKLKRLKALDTIATPPKREDFERLVQAIGDEEPSDYRDRAIFLVLLSTGLRVSELCSLTSEQIDLETGEFMIIGKGRYRRSGLVAGRALDALRDWVLDWRPKMHMPGITWLWLSSCGGKLTAKRVREMMQRRRKAAGIDGKINYPSGASKSILAPHAIRHLHATEMLRAGVSLPVIQASLGHRSLETTQIYLDIEMGDLRKSRAVFEDPHGTARPRIAVSRAA